MPKLDTTPYRDAQSVCKEKYGKYFQATGFKEGWNSAVELFAKNADALGQPSGLIREIKADD